MQQHILFHTKLGRWSWTLLYTLLRAAVTQMPLFLGCPRYTDESGESLLLTAMLNSHFFLKTKRVYAHRPSL